jgi:hypothetical protein
MCFVLIATKEWILRGIDLKYYYNFFLNAFHFSKPLRHSVYVDGGRSSYIYLIRNGILSLLNYDLYKSEKEELVPVGQFA